MKPSDICDDRFIEKIDYYSWEDKKRLLEHQKDFVSIRCPACDGSEVSEIFIKGGIHYQECSECKTVYASPRPTAVMLKDYYRNSQSYQYWCKHVFPASEDTRREKIVKPRVNLLLEYCRRFEVPTGTLLEIGSGFGTFCSEVMDRKLFDRVIGIEPTPHLAQKCRDRGITVIEKTIEEVGPIEENVDVIVSFETIEHMFSPKDFIKSCSEHLGLNGIFMLTCPNMLGFDTLILKDISDSVGGEHINMFNPLSLKILLSDCGFNVLNLSTPGRLDAEIVRNAILQGKVNMDNQAFLKYLLIDRWKDVGENLQRFLSDNLLSSHMLAVANKT